MPPRPDWMSQLIGLEIVQRINNDTRTTPATFLGYPKNQIFWDVICGGQADFDAPLGKLTGEDRALLYARYNQERHLDELRAAFAQLLATTVKSPRPTILDLGCGPFTCGLALAEILGANVPFRYYGIDISKSMCVLGGQLAEAARNLGAFHPETRVWFGERLSDADFGQIRGELTIAVASYLLASPTLQVTELVKELAAAHTRIGPGPMALLYTNTAALKANRKFPEFRDALLAEGFELKVDACEVFWETTRDPKPLRYALFFKGSKETVTLG